MRPVRASVRRLLPGDLRSLEAAEAACFSDPWPAQTIVSEILAPGRFNRILVDPTGQLMAYLISAWQYLDLHILKIGTLPRYQRQGLAARLMGLAEVHAEEQCGDSVTLEVEANNLAAIKLYKSLGYDLVGRRPGYYKGREDALVMTKNISPNPPGAKGLGKK